MTTEKLLRPKEAAKILQCTTGTLANWRSKETGPFFTKMPNGRVYYPENAVRNYLHQWSSNQPYNNSRMIQLRELMKQGKILV